MIVEQFKERLRAFYANWRIHKEIWGNSDIVVVSTPADKDASDLRSSRLFLWLFGEDLAATTAVFTPSSIFFLCTQESFARLRSLAAYAAEVMKIPVSIEVKPWKDQGFSKLDGIIRSMRTSLNSGKSLFTADLSCPLTVGCIADEMPKSKLLLSCVNGFEYFAKYRVVNVNSGVGRLIAQGIGLALADGMQYNRGIKRTLEDRIDAQDKLKIPLSGCLGKLEKLNLVKGYEEKNMLLGEANNDEGEFELANKPSLAVDQGEKTEPTENEGNLSSLDEHREFKQQCIDKLETEKDPLMKYKKAAQKVFSKTKERVTLFYSSWRKYKKELWGDSDVLVITTTSPSGSLATRHRPVSSRFLLWLIGDDFPNTTAIFTDRAIHFICPAESYPKLCSLGLNMTKAQVSVSIQPKDKAGDESELINLTVDGLRADRANDHPVIIGYIDGEAPTSKILDCCVANKDKRRFEATNVISGFVKLFNTIKKCTPEDNDIENLAENYQEIMSLVELWQKKPENKNELGKSEETSGKIGNLPSKFAEMNIVVEETKQLPEDVDGKIGNLPSKFSEMNIVVEDGTESKLVAEEGNSGNAQQVVLAEKEQDSESSNVRDDVIENSSNQSKESVVSKDDDWEIIEKHHEGQEPDTANDSSWRSWIGRRFSKAAGDEAS